MLVTDIAKLRGTCETVVGDPSHKVSEARSLMLEHAGVGIAAPQVGVNERWFWIGDKLIINPVLRWQSAIMTVAMEGCLSIPGVQIEIERPFQVSFTHRDGIATLTGYDARVFMHELDHLNGILIIDYIHRRQPVEDGNPE